MSNLTDLEEAKLYSARDPQKGDLWLICWHENHLVGIFPGPPVSIAVWHDLEVLDKEDCGYPLFVDPVPWPAGEHVTLINAGERACTLGPKRTANWKPQDFSPLFKEEPKA